MHATWVHANPWPTLAQWLQDIARLQRCGRRTTPAIAYPLAARAKPYWLDPGFINDHPRHQRPPDNRASIRYIMLAPGPSGLLASALPLRRGRGGEGFCHDRNGANECGA
jgi:hypothetical protein